MAGKIALGLVSLLFFASLVGVFAQSCSDSDGGKIYDVKGTITWNGYSMEDFCVNSQTIFENYCIGNISANETYTCPYNCSGGACTEAPEPNVTCTDSDGATDDYYTSGTVTVTSSSGGTLTVSETCLAEFVELAIDYEVYEILLNNMISAGVITTEQLSDGNIVLESYCPTGITYEIGNPLMFQHAYSCPYGCSDGACLSEPEPNATCTDSDGGKDYYVKGIVTGINIYGQPMELEDQCENENSEVHEYYCQQPDPSGNVTERNNRGWINYPCPNGCSDGACLSASGKPDLIVSDIYLSNATPSIGDRVTFYVEIKNIGDAAADSCRARNTITPAQKQGVNEGTPDEYYTDYTGSNYPMPQVYGKEIGPGETTTYNDYFNITSSSFEISTTVDIHNSIDESNENNNVLSKTFSVSGAACPASIDLAFDKSTYYVGDTLEVKLAAYDSQGDAIPNVIISIRGYLNGQMIGESSMSIGPTGVYTSTGMISSSQVGELQYNVWVNRSECDHVSDSETIIIKESETAISIPSVWSDKEHYMPDEKVTIYAKVVDNDGTPATPEEGTVVTYSIYVMHTMEYNAETRYYESTIESPGEGFWRVHATATKAGQVARNNDYYFNVISQERFMKTAIFEPSNGDTVSGIIRVHANAKSDTRIAGMELAIKGSDMGIEMPLKDCTSSSSSEGAHYMDCYYTWDTSNFQGKVALLLTSWNMNWDRAVDSINVYVSEGEGFIGIGIESPRSGAVVSGTHIIKVTAKSSSTLTGINLAIESGNTGVSFPLSDCEHEASACPVGEACKPVYGMTCEYKWNTDYYRGKKVVLRATAANVNNQKADNEVTVYVGRIVEGWTEDEVRKAFETGPDSGWLAREYGLVIKTSRGSEILNGISPMMAVPVNMIVEPWKKYWALGSEKNPPVYYVILEDASGSLIGGQVEYLFFLSSEIVDDVTLPFDIISLEKAEGLLIEKLRLEKFDTEQAGVIIVNFGDVAIAPTGSGGGGGMITGAITSSGGGGSAVPITTFSGGGGGGVAIPAYWAIMGTGIRQDGSTARMEILMDAKTGHIIVGPAPDTEEIIRKQLGPVFGQLGLKIAQIRQVSEEELEMIIIDMRETCEKIGPPDKGGIYWLVSDTEGVLKLLVREGRILQPVIIRSRTELTTQEIKQSISDARRSAEEPAEIKPVAVPVKEAIPITGGVVAAPTSEPVNIQSPTPELEITPVLMVFDVEKLSSLPNLDDSARRQVNEMIEKTKSAIESDLGATDLKFHELNMVMIYRTSYCAPCPAGKECGPCLASSMEQFVYARGVATKGKPARFTYILEYPDYNILCKKTSGMEKNDLNAHLWVSRGAVTAGETLIIKSKVTDHNGNPVPNAKVSLTMGPLRGVYTCPVCKMPSDVKARIVSDEKSTGIGGGYACKPCVYDEKVIQTIVGETDENGAWTYMMKVANIRPGQYRLELRAEKPGYTSGSDKKVITVKNIGPVENRTFKTIDLVRIVLKLETMNINILKLKPVAQAITNYYSSVGETEKAGAWQEVVNSIDAISAHITDIKTAIKDLVDNPSAEKLVDIKGGIVKIKREIEDLLIQIIRVV